MPSGSLRCFCSHSFTKNILEHLPSARHCGGARNEKWRSLCFGSLQDNRGGKLINTARGGDVWEVFFRVPFENSLEGKVLAF